MVRLLKLNVQVATTVDVTPVVTRLFHVTDEETLVGSSLTLDAGEFLDDTGATADELPALEADNSYYNLYVNGVLQMEDLSTYTPGATGVGTLEILVPEEEDGPLLEGTPIVLEIVNFTPTSTTDVVT